MSDPRLDSALKELHAAMAALPPNAVAPLANSFGEIVQADPMHASACVLRAIAALTSLKGALAERGAQSDG